MNTGQSSETSFPRLLRGLWGHLNRRRQWQTLVVTILMVCSAFAEVVTLGAVVPFIAVLVEPERAMAFGPVARVAEWVGITSTDQLVFPLAGAFLATALLAAALRFLVVWATTRLAMATGAELASKATCAERAPMDTVRSGPAASFARSGTSTSPWRSAWCCGLCLTLVGRRTTPIRRREIAASGRPPA